MISIGSYLPVFYENAKLFSLWFALLGYFCSK
jgi:hypothetical protein